MKMKWYDGIALALIYIAFVGVLILTAFIGRAIVFPEHANAQAYTNASTTWATPLQWVSNSSSDKVSIYYTQLNGTSSPYQVFNCAISLPYYCNSAIQYFLPQVNPDTALNNEGVIDSYVFVWPSTANYGQLFSVNLSDALASSTKKMYVYFKFHLDSPYIVQNGYEGYYGQRISCYSVNSTNCDIILPFSTSTPSGGGNIINITDNGMITSEWTCETTGSDTVCEATATTSVRAYDGPTYYEWLLVAGVILFILLYANWPRMSILRFKK